MGHPLWPLFDLRVRTERLELRLGTDEEIGALARLAAEGIHPEEFMPFGSPWTRQASPALERGVLQWHWRARGAWVPEDWTLTLLAICDGQVVGTQDLAAKHFAELRSVSTGSWLGRARQGQGLGKEMRAAVLALAFEGLGAEVAETFAFAGNEPSLGVTRALGYEANGTGRHLVEGVARQELRFRLTRDRWQATRGTYEVTVTGLESCRELFGADPDLPRDLSNQGP